MQLQLVVYTHNNFKRRIEHACERICLDKYYELLPLSLIWFVTERV